MPNGFSVLSNVTNSFTILGLLGSNFQFYSNFKSIFGKQTAEPDQMPYSVAFDMVRHCLPMSNKRDARLKLVKSILLVM